MCILRKLRKSCFFAQCAAKVQKTIYTAHIYNCKCGKPLINKLRAKNNAVLADIGKKTVQLLLKIIQNLPTSARKQRICCLID